MEKRKKLIKLLINLSHRKPFNKEDFEELYVATLYLMNHDIFITRDSNISSILGDVGFTIHHIGDHFYILDYDEEVKNKSENKETKEV